MLQTRPQEVQVEAGEEAGKEAEVGVAEEGGLQK